MIRPLFASDAVDVHAILLETFAAAEPGAPAWTLTNVISEIEKGVGLGAYEGRALVAFVLCRDLGSVREITYLATAPRARRKGRMSQLIDRLQAAASSDGEIWLEVHAANAAARRLYAKHGFRDVGLRPRYYADGGDAVLCSWPASAQTDRIEPGERDEPV